MLSHALGRFGWAGISIADSKPVHRQTFRCTVHTGESPEGSANREETKGPSAGQGKGPARRAAAATYPVSVRVCQELRGLRTLLP
jgi:hypothetical protein